MDYDLSRLTTREFEHLVQALAVGAFGPGVSVFGDGPDAGREATFEGSTSFPSSANGWNGYVVVQAKFRQRPGNPARDRDWLLTQLEAELAAYGEEHDGSRRRPEYLLLATNVVLTPPAGGAKDRVAERMERASAELGLKGWHVWAFDELRSLLDANESVRRAYGAWITPGDVLHAAMAAFGGDAPDFERTIARFLQKELLADQYAKLEQGGHAAQDKLPLGQLFVDLPVLPDALDRGRAVQADEPYGCMAHLVALAGHHRGSPLASPNEEQPPLRGETDSRRVVLVGGPGQGKSTVGQLLCQLHRMALLATHDPQTLTPEVRQALAAVEACVEREQLPLPRARRFPMRVTLSAFAEALADDDGPCGLLEYLVRRVWERTGEDVSLALFQRWLAEHPWLIILDGLDEVPRSSNREAVLTAVDEFWIDVAAAHSDVLVIATTRPQGYNEDFSPQQYAHYRLQPLEREDALRYGRLLVEQRHGDDHDTIATVTRRLERAAGAEATQRLMRTPLQVTIMTALVDHRGEPPEDRWSLFKAYYDVIYEREMRRDIPAARILRAYRADIDAIHQRVALLLQVKSEHARQTEGRLSHDQLATVVEQRLVEEGHEEPGLSALREEIMDAAALRLVFLVGLRHDSVGFEIRSLQEFMAAECLLAAPDHKVLERLSAVAGVASWRNVALFAAGHCFAERQRLRADIVCICGDLTRSDADPLARSRFAGAALAADVLLDGSVARQPRFKRLLASETAYAFRAVTLAAADDLAEIHDDDVGAVLRMALDDALEGSPVCRAVEGWRTLLALERDGVPWAAELIERHWPRDPPDALVLLGTLDGAAFGPTAAARLAHTLATQPLADVLAQDKAIARIAERPSLPWSQKLPGSMFSRNHLLRVSMLEQQLGRGAWSVLLPPLAHRGVLPFDAHGLHRSWTPLAAAAQFAAAPSAASLAVALRTTAERAEAQHWQQALRIRFPWPLVACFAFAEDRARLLALAAAADAGAFGDTAAWDAAERRWRERGVTLDDLEYVAQLPDAPFDGRIGEIGAPLRFAGWQLGSVMLGDALQLLRGVYASVRSPRNRAMFARFLLRFFAQTRWSDGAAEPSLADILEWQAAGAGRPTFVSFPSVVRWVGEVGDDGSLDALDALVRGVRLEESFVNRATRPLADLPRLVEALRAHPEAGGLQSLLAQAVAIAPIDDARTAAAELRTDALPDDPLARAAAGILRIYTMSDLAEAAAVADAIAGVPVEHADLLEIALPSPGAAPSDAAHELVLAHLAKQLPCTAVDARVVVASAADDLLLRRTSKLHRREDWDALGLFVRDERLLQP